MSPLYKIVSDYSKRPPFAAFDCASALGITVSYAPSARDMECFYAHAEDGTPERSIILSDTMASKPDHMKRFAVTVGISHFIHHELHIKKQAESVAIFKHFLDTSIEFDALQVTQARHFALEIMRPPYMVDAIIRDADTLEDAVRQVTETFAIPEPAARITVTKRAVAIPFSMENTAQPKDTSA